MKKSQYAILTVASLLVVGVLGPVFAATNFTISASPSSATIAAGTSFTSTITVTSNRFAGSVGLSSAVSPATNTITASLSPSSVTVTSGGSATSTLTVNTTPFTPLGTYTITVTGTGGGQSQSTPVTVTVTTGTVGAAAQPHQTLTTLPIIELSVLIATTGVLAGIALKRTRTPDSILA